MGEPQVVCVTRVQLFKFQEETGTYAEYGTVGCAIMGTAGTAYSAVYKLGCYNDGGEYLCTAPITANNESGAHVALQGNGYVSFKDESGKMWSMLFPNEEEAVEFGANVAVAMYGVANQPEASIVAFDVTEGKKDRVVYSGDRVKVRYQSWVMTRGGPGVAVPKLGSRLESNEHDEKPHVFTVPVNHMSVTADMKGYEGMVVGLAEEGRRFIVIPQGAKRGSGPRTHQVFLAHIVKKKDPEPGDAQNSAAAGRGNNGIAAQQQQQQQFSNNGPGAYGQQQAGGMYGGNVNGDFGGYGQLALVGQQPPQQQQPYGALALAPVQPPVAAAPAPLPPRAPTPPPPPPAGFDLAQLALVDRLRDQVAQLQAQLKDATMKLDLFNSDFKQHNAKLKPQSLTSAQIEHSVQALLQQTDEFKEQLTKRDEMLRQVEEKNRDLQNKVDRFSSTANQLAEEKKALLNNTQEAKISADQQVLQLQAQLTRIMDERQDISRHLTTVKRLLEVSDTDMKAEKGKLQVAAVQMQTNEAKMATTEERLHEEQGRRKLLEGKCTSLGAELRDLQEELRTKLGQIEERKRKMDADKLHYTQLMDTERAQAASELRELRQELVEELGIRELRYQEERQRVAVESFERGKLAGIDHGHSDAMLEADAKIQELTLSVQRSKSEVETIKIRLRQTSEAAESDQRRLNAQISALTRVVDDLSAQNSHLQEEIGMSEAAKQSIEHQTYETIAASLRQLSRPISRKDLIGVVHQLRVRLPVDLGFEPRREEEEAARLAKERAEVAEWVTRALTNPDKIVGQCPPLRTRHEQATLAEITAAEQAAASADEAARRGGGAAAGSGPASSSKQQPSAVALVSESQLAAMQAEQRAADEAEAEAVTKRYRELLTQIGEQDPLLGLVKPKEPTPPPTPPRTPTPEPPPLPPPPAPKPQQAQEAPSKKLPSLDDSDSDLQEPAASPAVGPPAPKQQQQQEQEQQESSPQAAAAETDSEAEAETSRNNKKFVPQAAAAARSDSDGDDDVRPPAKAAPKAAAKKAPAPKRSTFADDDESDENAEVADAQPPARSSTKRAADDREADEAPVPPAAPPVAAPAPPAKSAAFAEDEGSDIDAPPPPAPAPKAKAASAAPAPKKSTMFDDGDDSEADDAGGPGKPSASSVAVSAAAPPKRAAPKQVASTFAGDSDEDEEAVAPRAAPAAKSGGAPATKASAKASAPVAAGLVKKKSMFDDSDDDDSDGGAASKRAAPAPKAKVTPAAKAGAKKAPAKKASMFGDSESD